MEVCRGKLKSSNMAQDETLTEMNHFISSFHFISTALLKCNIDGYRKKILIE